MKKVEHFKKELALIIDEDLRQMVESYLTERVPDHFWTDGASSSGKYHPKFSQGVGGLVRHTKAVVMFAEELLRMSSYAYMREEYKDYVFAACILHDTMKYGLGEFDKNEYKNHAANAAYAFKMFAKECDYEVSEYLLNAIRAHMGQWSTNSDDKPFTNLDRCVHLADYMASRNFIDIPQIMEDWLSVEGAETSSTDAEIECPF